jgi:Lrp/AsnC family leucine-responsive transcriptional regulator
MTEQLDAIDLKILRELQQNCRLTTKELAARVNLSTTPVFDRVRRLENSGYISAYTARLNAEKLDMGFVVFCNVKLQCMNRENAINFTTEIKEIGQVTECYNVSGRFDYLLKIYARSMKDDQEFIINRLGRLENIGSIESTFVMSHVKQDTGLPI